MLKLTSKQREKLLEAIPLIAVYVAFADGSLDRKEVDSAKRIANLRRFSPVKEAEIRKYYNEALESFDDRFYRLVAALPEDNDERTQILESRLEEVNTIIQSVNPFLRHKLIQSFLSFAQHVAKAEGTFLGMGGIGPAQASAMKLKMFTDSESL
ncbi:MAG: hypothetical protein EA409_12065 [Saprospirales bacterium]|nr:MAG: hypothetical protein EA409_12065 [Saprospirales bacterium]